ESAAAGSVLTASSAPTAAGVNHCLRVICVVSRRDTSQPPCHAEASVSRVFPNVLAQPPGRKPSFEDAATGPENRQSPSGVIPLPLICRSYPSGSFTWKLLGVSGRGFRP